MPPDRQVAKVPRYEFPGCSCETGGERVELIPWEILEPGASAQGAGVQGGAGGGGFVRTACRDCEIDGTMLNGDDKAKHRRTS